MGATISGRGRESRYVARQTVTECLTPLTFTVTLLQIVVVPCVAAVGSADALASIEWAAAALALKTLDAIDLPNDSKLLAAAAALQGHRGRNGIGRVGHGSPNKFSAA